MVNQMSINVANINNPNVTMAPNSMNTSNMAQQINSSQQMTQILNRINAANMNQQNAPIMTNQMNPNQQHPNTMNVNPQTARKF